MSVHGYWCREHKFQHECDVSESGERICRECENWVSGIVVDGKHKMRRSDKKHDFKVIWGHSGDGVNVKGYTIEDVVNETHEKVPKGEAINKVIVLN